MRQALGEYAITFFTLLNESYKQETYAKRWDLVAATYPNMDEDRQQEVSDSLVLPDDILSEILDSEIIDDINTLKEAFDGN